MTEFFRGPVLHHFSAVDDDVIAIRARAITTASAAAAAEQLPRSLPVPFSYRCVPRISIHRHPVPRHPPHRVPRRRYAPGPVYTTTPTRAIFLFDCPSTGELLTAIEYRNVSGQVPPRRAGSIWTWWYYIQILLIDRSTRLPGR